MRKGAMLAMIILVMRKFETEINQREMDQKVEDAPHDRTWTQQAEWHQGSARLQAIRNSSGNTTSTFVRGCSGCT